MYRQFCRNLKNYLDINRDNSYRYKIGKEIEILSDVKLYTSLKESGHEEYMKISNFIYQMSRVQNLDISKFVWELWAYGFDIRKFDDVDLDKEEDLHEKIKLIDLLLGTHYWN